MRLTFLIAVFAMLGFVAQSQKAYAQEETFDVQAGLFCSKGGKLSPVVCRAHFPRHHDFDLDVHFVKCYFRSNGSHWRNFLRYSNEELRSSRLVDLVLESAPLTGGGSKHWVWHQITLFRIPHGSDWHVEIWGNAAVHGAYCHVFGKRILLAR